MEWGVIDGRNLPRCSVELGKGDSYEQSRLFKQSGKR